MFDTDVSFNPLTSVADGKETKQSDTKQADYDKKVKALDERDHALASKEQARSTEWDDKMKDLQERQAKSAREEEERTASYDRKLKDLQDREAALSRQKEEDKLSNDKTSEDKNPNDNEAQAQREADLQRKLDDLSSAEQKLAFDRAALQKSQRDLEKREKDIAQLQKELEASKTSDAPKPSPNAHTTSDKDAEQRLEKTQKHNASLEQRLVKLEDQLSKMGKSPEKQSDGKPQTNGTVNAPKPSKADAGLPGCGYKHYKPPRKLNRKLIGMVYE
jgi:colicin import membrane protein